MSLVIANNAISTLATGISDSATSLTLQTGDGALFPTLAAGQWHPLTIEDGAGNMEIVRCTARSSDTLTITRAQEGTSAQAFSAGARVALRLTEAAFEALVQASLLNTFTKAQRGTPVTLSDGANIAIDLSAANHFTVTLAGNRTLNNPSNMAAGQSGVIVVTQDGTGSRTLAFGSQYVFADGAAPELSTAAGAIDILAYQTLAADKIFVSVINDVKEPA